MVKVNSLLFLASLGKFAIAEPWMGCEFPGFDWAVHSSGPSGSFQAYDAKAAGDYLFVAGQADSINPDDEGVDPEAFNYALTGPYTESDPVGLLGTTILAAFDHVSELSLQVIERNTGKPVDVIRFPDFDVGRIFGVGAADLISPSSTSTSTSTVSVGGSVARTAFMAETISCTPTNNGLVSVSCDGDSTTLEAVTTSDDDSETQFSFLVAMEVNESSAGADSEWNGVTVKWVINPWSGSSYSRVIHTVVDPTSGDILAVGHSCDADADNDTDGDSRTCKGWVGKFAADNGSIIWRREFPTYSNLYGIEIDVENGLVFFTGFEEPGQRGTVCLEGTTGDVIWSRSFTDGYRINRFTGEVKLAKEADGPYIYVAHSLDTFTQAVSLDQGTPYAACLDGNTKIPAYEIVQDKFLTEDDCTSRGYSFIPSSSEDAIPAVEASSGVECGVFGNSYYQGVSCVIKYHKFTGQPQWSSIIHSARGMETSDEGPLIVGPYDNAISAFDGVQLADPSFFTITHIYQALLNKDTGVGTYVQGYYDKSDQIKMTGVTQDSDGNLYIVASSFADDFTVGSEGFTIKFPTTVDKTNFGDTFNNLDGRHWSLLVAKILTGPGSSPIIPSCVACDAQGMRTSIADDYCYVDQICFKNQRTALDFLDDASLVCDTSVSQTELVDIGFGGNDICDVCGEGKEMTKPEALFDASAFGFGEQECGYIDELGRGGLLPDVPGISCADIAVLIQETCGCVGEETPAPTRSPTRSPPVAPDPIEVEEEGSKNNDEGNDGLAAGAIVGIVVGSLVFVGLIALVASRSRSPSGSPNVEFDSNSPAIRAAIDAHEEMKGSNEVSSTNNDTSDKRTQSEVSDNQPGVDDALEA